MQETKQQRYLKTEKGKEANRRGSQKWRDNHKEDIKKYMENYKKTDRYKELKREQNRRYREKMKQKITQMEK